MSDINNINNRQGKKRGRLMMIIGIIIAGLLLPACNIESMPKIYRVGILSGIDLFIPTIEGFKAEMTELGYVEGKTISYDLQSAGGEGEKMKRIAEKFVADRVDLIFTTTTGGAKAAQIATVGSDIPVVFTMVSDPMGSGLVNDLRNPGGNITGVGRPFRGFAGKRLEFLLQMAPDIKRVWLPYNPDYPTTAVTLQRLREAAPVLAVTLIEMPVDTVNDVMAELAGQTEQEGPDFEAIYIVPDPVIQHDTSWQAILAFANLHNLPISGNVPLHVQQGALFSYVDNDFETGRLAASLAAEILQGGNPATIPLDFGEPQLIINYQVAQRLGLTIEDSLLAQAAEIIR